MIQHSSGERRLILSASSTRVCTFGLRVPSGFTDIWCTNVLGTRHAKGVPFMSMLAHRFVILSADGVRMAKL